MSSDPLARVRRAVKSKRRAEDEYRAALVAAVTDLEAAGARNAYAQVADAAGVRRQSLRELVDRARS